jgi:hypothetical protein
LRFSCSVSTAAVLHQAIPQAAASGLLALAGLLASARWARRTRPRTVGLLAGGGLLTGALLLLI